MKRNFLVLTILVVFILSVGLGFNAVLAASGEDSVQAVYVIRPDDLQGWAFYAESGSGTNSFMLGPDTPPIGTGSIQLQIAGPTDGYILYKYGWISTLFSSLTSLTYATYQDPASLGDVTQLPALVINADYDLTDSDFSWQGRLIYEPYLTPGNTPVKGAWQTWDALGGYWWADGAPGNTVCPLSSPCLLSTLLASYPNAGIAGALGFKVGSGWANGFIGNVDDFVIGISGSTDTYDFEPLPPLVTDLDLWQSVDTTIWTPVPGSYADGFAMLLEPAVEWYYLDTNMLTVTRPLADGYHPFYIDTYPAGFFDYWAARGVDGTPPYDEPWQPYMWEIINGSQPIFYLKVTGTDYMLIDGLTYQMSGMDTYLRINGTYLLGGYAFSGTLTDTFGFTDEVTEDITFLGQLELTDLDLWHSVDMITWTAVPGTYANGFTMPLDLAVEWYYLDTNTLTINRPVADGYHPFFVNTYPAGFFDYWAARGVVFGATGWQGIMWEIINGNQPIFYLKVTGTDTMLVDGLTYQLYGTDTYLKINGTYLPGFYTFSGMLTDAFGYTDDVSVDITFDDVPVADDQSVSTNEDTALPITLTATDQYPGTLTWSIVTGPAHGALSGTAPALTYTPATNYHGSDSFTFKVNDGTVDSNTATVTIDVTSVNDVPVADGQSVTTAEDTAVAVTLTASDADGDLLTWTIVTGPAHGALSGAAPVLTYTPAANYHGPDSFTFKVNDGTVDSNTATVSIDVTSVNDLPVADDQLVTTAEDTAVAITLTASDADGDPLTWSIVTGPTHGALSGTAPALTYTPAANYHGPDSFTFKVNDGTVDSNIATVSVDVTSVNDLPVADEQSVTTAEDTSLDILLTASDADGDPLTWIIMEEPVHGALVGTAPALTYVPDSNYYGSDSFTFKVNDGSADSNTAMVIIDVTAINDAPVAVDDAYNMDEDTTLVIAAPGVLTNDTDVEADPLTAVLLVDVLHGTLTLNADGSFTYTPDANFFGIDTFTYIANDGTADSNIATVTISVGDVAETYFTFLAIILK